MEKRTSWLIVVLLVAQFLMLAVAPATAESEVPTGAYEPESITLDSDTMHQIATLGVQMQGYLTLNKDGTLALGDVDVAALGITDEYLESYKAALEYVNGAIKAGLFAVDEDFQVSWPEEAEPAASMEAPKSAEPAWGGYPYGQGLYVNFGYNEAQYYLPRYGLATALSLASYIRRPYIVTPYTYHFTYYRIYRYYYRYNYPYYGTWSYVPWSYLGYYSSCCYQPAYRYIYYWYPYGRYWYYHWCYY